MVVCTLSLEELPAFLTEVQPGCSISWFISPASDLAGKDFRKQLTSIVSVSPSFVHVFGDTASRIHDELDRALREADHFALTVWSQQYTADEAVFDIFRVDFPAVEATDQWTSRVIILDQLLLAAERAILLEKLCDPDRSIREYLVSKESA